MPNFIKNYLFVWAVEHCTVDRPNLENHILKLGFRKTLDTDDTQHITFYILYECKKEGNVLPKTHLT